MNWVGVYKPLMLVPTPDVFLVPKKCPKSVQKEISSAFKIFLADPSAAANRVRSAIENLLTELGVRRLRAVAKRRMPIPLHERILLYGKRNKDIAESLLAVKWIGNAGSHNSEMTLDDVLDAFEIFETVLDDLYVGHRGRVRTLVTAVNKGRGPLKPRQRRK
jgi:hypothetical protein